MTQEEKLKLITRNLEETLTEEELKSLIASGTPLKHYIGFEISGKVHLGTGLAAMYKIKDLQDAGVHTIVFLADWHTWINKKLDGTLETAKKMAREYFEEAMKAAALCVGADPDKIEFILGSELYEKDSLNYWASVIKVAKATTISRMMRSTTITGREAGQSSDAAILIYPAMQAADIFKLGVNIAHAGTDQRNVHVVAREVAKDLGKNKPIALHHHLLQGLLKLAITEDTAQDEAEANKIMETMSEVSPIANERLKIMLKMSKSKPDSAVFIHDTPDEIKRKLNAAYAPEGVVKLNPVLDWTKHLIFYEPNSKLTIYRPEKWGGNLEYSSYEQLEKDYLEKQLHPQDLKVAVAQWLITKLEPAREYFEEPKRRQALEEIEKLTTR